VPCNYSCIGNVDTVVNVCIIPTEYFETFETFEDIGIEQFNVLDETDTLTVTLSVDGWSKDLVS